MSLPAGSVRFSPYMLGMSVVDFVDLALRLRCSEEHAWRLCIMPLLKNGPGQRLLTVVLLLDLEQQRLHPAMPEVQQDISPRSFGVQGSNDHDQHPDIPTVAVFPTAAGFLTLSLYDHHHD